MISDDARKVLAVIWNMYRHEWVDIIPDLPTICLRAGRSERVVRDALNELIKAEYLTHKDGKTLIIWSSPLDRQKASRTPKY